MAPEASLPKRKPRENQYLFNLGVRGRKTGLTVPDTGIRDENGLEPMDHLFSSPEKAAPKTRSTKRVNGTAKNANATISSEEDMDVGESTIPEPTAVLTKRKRASMRMPPPRSKSPIKTFLQSPARRNPSLGPVSSPTRGSIIEPKVATTSASVRRKLDFSTNGLDVSEDSAVTSSSPQKRAGSSNQIGAAGKLSNGTRLSPLPRPFSPENAGGEDQDDTGVENGEDSYQLVNGGDEEGEEEEEEEEAPVDEEEESHEREPEPEPVKSSRGRLKPTKATAPAAVAKKGRAGRPKNVDPSPAEEQEEPEERPAKRARKSLEPEAPKPSKGGRPKKTAAAPNPPKAKPAGRKPKLATISEADSPQVQRGPPMPRNNRGLFILRRETPMEGTGFKQTRSGRNSIKPLAYWKNERVEYSEDENEDNYGKFLLPRIKEVVRAEETEEPKRPKTKSRSTKSKKRAREPESEDDDETEPWETEPGRVIGEIRSWDPEDQTGSQAEEVEEEIALSSAAIITREIKDTTFRFAKTLTLPFFGSGMVDLPPGAIKKPKNSRKMQMVFFVFYGRVQVTVNDTVFRIGKGGMWQVPRGNFYSIENDYDKPARIFFSQGCEILNESAEGR